MSPPTAEEMAVYERGRVAGWGEALAELQGAAKRLTGPQTQLTEEESLQELERRHPRKSGRAKPRTDRRAG